MKVVRSNKAKERMIAKMSDTEAYQCVDNDDGHIVARHCWKSANKKQKNFTGTGYPKNKGVGNMMKSGINKRGRELLKKGSLDFMGRTLA